MSSISDVSIDHMTDVVTTMKIITAGIRWKIENFFMADLKTSIESPPFYSKDKKYSWSLTFSPKRILPPTWQRPGEWLSVEVNRLDNNVLPPVKYSIYLLGGPHRVNGELLTTHCLQSGSYKTTFLKERSELLDAYFWNHFKNTTTIICKIYVLEDIITESNDLSKNDFENNLVEDLNKMFIEPDFSDITILTEEKEFKLHKAILAARSPVFAAMFKSPMQEASENVVKVSHINTKVLEELFCFIYTGKSSKLKDMVEDLCKAADYYGINTLKEKCISEMLSRLTLNNAVTYLLLSENYNAPDMKLRLIAFIIENICGVNETEDWKALVETHPYLTNEIYKDSVKRLNP